MPTNPEPCDDLAELHGELFERCGLVPIELGGMEERAWADCDLASLAENRLREQIDPRVIDEAQRDDWRRRATSDPEYLPRQRDIDRCCWIVERGERIGTIALSTSLLGGRHMKISSLYVVPPCRHRGVGSGVLREIVSALGPRGLALKLTTSWTWQRPVGLYVRMGMWIRTWKRELEFTMQADDPRPVFEADELRASMGVDVGGRRIVLLVAERVAPERLHIQRVPTNEPRVQALGWQADSTFALQLGLHGWPLLRSLEEYRSCYLADAGPPEALAYRIMLWEAWDRKHGWVSDAPKIPGLHYPTWDELEAHWAQSAPTDGSDAEIPRSQ